jgi:Cdc6-like AAA superfamily ATPase
MTSDNISKGANAHIREYLDYYCHLSNPKFAVLLKGPWGSGKTWLIKKFMDDFKLIKDLNQSTSNFKFLYISLYGMQTLEEVEREFLRQLYSFSGSRELEFLAESISRAIQFNLSLFPFGIRIKPTLSLKNLPEYFKNVDQRILIFDDLERCHVEIDHVLGYINSFIEHKSAKVIIVANEEKLYPSHDDENQQQRHKYQYIKEKIIGQTLEVKFSFQETIESLMKDLYKDELIQNEEVESFIKTQSETIEIIYQNAEYKNIRTLRKIILDFNRIWASLPANVIQKEEAIQELFELQPLPQLLGTITTFSKPVFQAL